MVDNSEIDHSFIQIIVPVYNEGENVRLLYSSLSQAFVPYDRLTFVYDFDEDTTVPVIEELAQINDRIVGERNDFGPGVLNALKWGFSKAVDGPVIVVMGDNSDKLSLIPEMIDKWRNGAIIVSPSRYMPGGVQHGGGWLKSGLSRAAGKSLKFLGFPTSDPTNNFKLYDGAWLRQQTIESTGGFEIALELCCKAYTSYKRIEELPTEWFDRTAGESQFKLLEWIPKYLKWYFLAVGAILKR